MIDVQEQLTELLHVTRRSLVNTGKGLYPDLFSLKPSPLHYKLSDSLVNSDKSTVLTFPREFGKSTYVWEGMGSWNIMHRKYNYMLYLGSTATKAQEALHNLTTVITQHPILQGLITVERDTKDVFQYSIGEEKFMVKCYGAGQKLRGTRYLKHRPDLIICDDLEDLESVRSEDQRKKLKDWFWADVIPLGKSARIFYVGTMLHEDCLLANLQRNPPEDIDTGELWDTFRFGVIDETTGEATWPEKYDDIWIEKKRKEFIKQGMLYRFNTEYMNIAVAREDRVFSPERVNFYSPEQLKTVMNSSFDKIVVVDPGIKPDGDHDPTVVMTTGMDSIGNIWILDVKRERMLKTKILDSIVESYTEWNPREVYIEAVQGQEYLAQDLENGTWPGGIIMRVERIDGRQIQMGKTRIYGLEPIYQQKKLWVPASAIWWTDFCDEMVTFPRGAHDDMLDCLAYAMMNHIKPNEYKLNIEELLTTSSPTVF